MINLRCMVNNFQNVWRKSLLSKGLCSATSSDFVSRVKTSQSIKDGYKTLHEKDLLDSKSQVFLFNRSKILLQSNSNEDFAFKIPCATWKDINTLSHTTLSEWVHRSVFVGVCPKDQLLYALDVSSFQDDKLLTRVLKYFSGEFQSIRQAFFFLHETDSSLLSKAAALLNWHRFNQFCSQCGNRSKSLPSGAARYCPSCKKTHYPISAPVVITLLVSPDSSKALLVRNGRHPPGLYSCVAGYLDYGENMDGCLQREVAEEVGLEVIESKYITSQHWPFPGSSLMLGCIATVRESQLDIDYNELEDAQWISKSDAVKLLERPTDDLDELLSKENKILWIPPKETLAHKLIRIWAMS